MGFLIKVVYTMKNTRKCKATVAATSVTPSCIKNERKLIDEDVVMVTLVSIYSEGE